MTRGRNNIRGRGRGRGGRDGRRGRGGSRRRIGRRNPTNFDTKKKVPVEVNLETNPQEYFTSNITVEQHYNGQNENRVRYSAAMAVLQENGVEVAQNARIRALATAWARKDFQLAESFLQNRDNFGLNEVLKALQLLDAGRQARVLEKKMKMLQVSKNKVKPKMIGKLKSDIYNLNRMKSPYGSASGAVCKHIRRWVRHFTAKELEFYAIHFPKDPWKKLADICHFHPQKDFPSLEWFLPYCYGQGAPPETTVGRMVTMTAENVNEMLEDLSIPYLSVKSHKDKLTNASKGHIADREDKLDTILWWYEELACKEVDDAIQRRLENGDPVTLPIGKLLERLLVFKRLFDGSSDEDRKAKFYRDLLRIAEDRLKQIKLPLESPVLVMGDASSSMSVAVKTSTIIAGILTAITSAKLSFFNGTHKEPEKVPTNVEEVLQLALNTPASGYTANAASLYPFYERKEVLKTLIMVTDEEEILKFKNFRFKELYTKYCEEVYPAKLVFVSFLQRQHAKGQMVSQFKAEGTEVMQFVFHRSQPDLTKLDKLFGLLSAETQTFEDQIKTTEERIKTEGVSKVFKELKTS
ncbi:uncharacterized protein LOC133185443 [Saccostrea echinata]|uniref:uncharacterized protein LOC133185443 n=1 Tax=Saccostrea echinata TaxID=191078 RepID=UPI002A82423C|nr:uncharacterized protein LOC133185443 [Saccostrea echinata]